MRTMAMFHTLSIPFKFLLLSMWVRAASSATQTVMWEFLTGGATYSPLTAFAGDIIRFEWTGNHNVYIHDTGDCTFAADNSDRTLVSNTSPASYTITPADVGRTITFACDVGQHCEIGSMIIQVNVLEMPSASPSESPSYAPSTSAAPSYSPSYTPSYAPSTSKAPSYAPSTSKAPSYSPSYSPSYTPSSMPSTTSAATELGNHSSWVVAWIVSLVVLRFF